jgi:outer membrane protein assembly factor BamD
MKQPNRDQDATRKALAQLKTLKTRYPESTYAQKADNQIRLCEDTLAAQEMEVGRYYLKQGNYIAAINRFKTVVTEYQTTAHVEEALYRLTTSYLALGIAPEGQNAAAVLGYNFPNSSWYKESYALLQKQGLMPKVSQGSWMTDVLKSPPKGPAAPPAAPAPAAPAQDWPAATTTPETPKGPPPPLSLGGPST